MNARALQRVDVAALRARARGVAWQTLLERLSIKVGRVTHNGERVTFCCPAHADRNPSANGARDQDDPIWHCPVCNAGGGIFELVAAASGINITADFHRAAEAVSAVLGEGQVPLTSGRAPSQTKAAPPPVPPRAPLDLDGELSHALLTLDHPHAKESGVIAYLEQRKLLAEAVADGWRVLSAPDVLYMLDERLAMDGDPADGDLARAGLIGLRDDGWRVDWSNHVLVIPWRTPGGLVDTIQRRQLGAAGTRYVFAANRGPRHLYGIERLMRAPADAEIVVVEGAVDALARRKLDTQGRVVLGLPGASSWLPQWASIAQGRTVRIATDDDKAGDGAAERIAADVWAAGAVRVVRERSKGMDWAQLVAAETK